MKTFLVLLVLVTALFGQQYNSSNASLCVQNSTNCIGTPPYAYAAVNPCSSQLVDLYISSQYGGAYFEIWGSHGAPAASTTVCGSITTELDVPNAVLLFSGTLPSFGIATIHYGCVWPAQLDVTIQVIVTFSGGCGFDLSAATHITTP